MPIEALLQPASAPVLMGGLVVWEDAFAAAEIDAIERYGDRLAIEKAEVSDTSDRYNSVRIAKVAWLDRNAQTERFYHRMEEIVLHLNSRFFHYDLFGLLTFQYTIYDGSDGSHFDWHKDYGRDPGNTSQEPRKLSFSLQLTDPSRYEGCELQIRAGNQRDEIAPKKRGTIIAFPSYVVHRVTPILSGTRKSLVVWAAGPDFR